MTDRIKVSAQIHTTNVFYGHIPDEITGQELVTRNRIETVTFQRYRVVSSLMGNSKIDIPIDSSARTVPAEEYELYDSLQPGLEHSTENKPYTFIWRVGTHFEPFFEEVGRYYVVIRFRPREGGETEMLTFEVNVT